MNWNKFINFDQLIMPSVIKVIYVLGSAGIIATSINILRLDIQNEGMSFEGVSLGIVVLLGGLLAVRLYCELIIVLFKISANVSKIAGKTD